MTRLPVAELADQIEAESAPQAISASALNPELASSSRVLTTLHSWPQLEPVRWAWYGSQYLDMPLRRDLLHRAVVYEGDAHRRGTASTKWRGEVHGSNRKILQQKGTGRARAGDKKSPIRKGGGVAHGPKPRSFATALQRKVYDQAWRTALSFRYRKGELFVVDDKIAMPNNASARFLANLFQDNRWGKGYRRSLVVTDIIPDDLASAMKDVGEHGLVKDIEDVDVKDMLETGRIVIERKALDALLVAHSSDISTSVPLARARRHVSAGFHNDLSRFQYEVSTIVP